MRERTEVRAACGDARRVRGGCASVRAQTSGSTVSGHPPLSASDRVARPGRVVGIFREPLKRIASCYAHNFHDCKPLQRRYKCSTSHSDFTCASSVPKRAEEATALGGRTGPSSTHLIYSSTHPRN